MYEVSSWYRKQTGKVLKAKRREHCCLMMKMLNAGGGTQNRESQACLGKGESGDLGVPSFTLHPLPQNAALRLY